MTSTLRFILFECVHIITLQLVIGLAFLSLFMPSLFVFLEEIYIKTLVGIIPCFHVILDKSTHARLYNFAIDL